MKSIQLLISVRSVREALDVQSLADWVDLKEPRYGSLGAVAAGDAIGICANLAESAKVSAAAGELRDWPAAASRRLLEVDRLGVLKLGLAGAALRNGWRQGWHDAAQEIAAAGKQLAAVAYADHQAAAAPPPEEVAEFATAEAARYFLIDTWDKTAGSLLKHLSSDELDRVLRRARDAGSTTIAAGSLGTNDLQRLPLQSIDVVAVRGAVCLAGRTGSASRTAAELFRRRLDELAPG